MQPPSILLGNRECILLSIQMNNFTAKMWFQTFVFHVTSQLRWQVPVRSESSLLKLTAWAHGLRLRRRLATWRLSCWRDNFWCIQERSRYFLLFPHLRNKIRKLFSNLLQTAQPTAQVVNSFSFRPRVSNLVVDPRPSIGTLIVETRALKSVIQNKK